MQDRPQVRRDGTFAEHLGDEVVVYDETSATAHNLSAEAALVWGLCDGEHSPDCIAAQSGLEPLTVMRILSELNECGLLGDEPPALRAYSRREAAARLAKAGGFALSAPYVFSIAIGPAAAAASTTITTCFGANPGGHPSGAQAPNGTLGFSTSALCGGGTSNQFNHNCYVTGGALAGVTVCASPNCNIYNSGCSGFPLQGTCCAGLCTTVAPHCTS